MKKLSLYIIALLTITIGRAQTGTLQVQVNKAQLVGFCNLGGAPDVYFHSGAGTSSVTAAWEHIVGNWGMADGIGKMDSIGVGLYSITFNLFNYYSNAKPDSLHGGEGTGPMLAGQTVYNIGCVFRNGGPCPVNPAGGKRTCIEGKDDNCKDIFLVGVNTPSIQVTNQVGDPFVGVTATWVTTGIQNVVDDNRINIYPNPFKDETIIDFNFNNLGGKTTVELFDLLGNRVADLSNLTSPNSNTAIHWNSNGIPSGIYFIRITNGNNSAVKKLVKQ